MGSGVQKKGQSGVIMLESLIVVLATVLLMFFTLAMFSILFQRYMLRTIADETAAKIAQNYALGGAVDISSGKMGLTEYAGVDPYRYMFDQFLFLESAAEIKASEYMKGRLDHTTYNALLNTVYAVEVTEVTLGRRYVAVTIEGEMEVPFGETLEYFGFGDIITYSTQGYADCVDLSHYVNTVDYVEKWTASAGNNAFINKAVKVMKAFGSLHKIIT